MTRDAYIIYVYISNIINKILQYFKYIVRYTVFHASTETIIRRITTNCNMDRQLIIMCLRHYNALLNLVLSTLSSWILYSVLLYISNIYIYIYIYMLFTGLEVRMGIYFPRSQKRLEAEGRGMFLRPREIFPHTERPRGK